MIGYVKGQLDTILSDSVLIDNHGIGYHIYTSSMAIEQIASIDGEVKLYTYLHVREDEMSLYGFPTNEELSIFRMLISVNGIGPKAALSILSILTVNDLSYAIMSGDAKAITKANGVGAKGANRVIMELKDKIDFNQVIEDSLNTEVTGNSDVDTNIKQDTILALVSLGYSETDAMKAVNQISMDQGMTSEDLLKLALKRLF